MSIKGPIHLLDTKSADVYTEFFLNGTETIRVSITKTVDGATSAYDVSSAALTVKLRARVQGTSTLIINQTMTKINGGTTGIVSVDTVFADTAWTAGQVAEMAIIIINTGAADALTPSGYQEYTVYGKWLADITSGLSD